MAEPENPYRVESIKIVDGIEHVRKRPGMYVGSTGPTGIGHLLDELVANSADQFLMGHATYCHVTVTHGESGWTYEVEDDGAGLPFDLEQDGKSYAEHYLTSVHFTPTRDDHAPHVHRGGLHGVGLGVVAALCSEMEVTTWRAGKRWRLLLNAGRIEEGPTAVDDGDGCGTRIRLVPDSAIFGDAAPELHHIRARLFEGVHLLAGWRVHYQDERFVAPQGLLELAPLLMDRGLSFQPLQAQRLQWRTERLRAEVVLCGQGTETTFHSWCNGMATEEGGSHVEGVRRALEATGVAPDMALVHVVFEEPCYAGPTRRRLDVDWVVDAIASELIGKVSTGD